MRTRSPGRLRTLAVGGVVLGGVAVGGSALTATAADAATMAPNAASCGATAYYVPQGDVALMTAPASGLRYIVAANVTATDSGPVGYVASVYDFPGQTWKSDVQSPLSTSSQTEISSFGVTIGFDDQTSQYAPELVFSSCTWTAQFISEPTTTSPYSYNSGAASGTDMAGYYQGMAQYQGIMNSVNSDEGAGITADPGGDAGAGGDL
jgi:hypothetical protein